MRIIFLLLLIYALPVSAREGMWMPQLLGTLNEKEMREMGMQLTAEDLYSTERSSLKDAVVHFGSGCTGEIISDKGLVITNHHCGFSQIQSLSTLKNNYLENGFWADSLSREIPCPGLTVTFIIKIENVTSAILSGLSDTLEETLRDSKIKLRMDSLEKAYSSGTNVKAVIKPYFNGNEYFITLSETYRDIRFVGAPPKALGNFGGESDNWLWPRHTADFSLFRIYAGKDNKPADYSTDNVPFHPKKFFTINISGAREGDFVFVYGFPGTTKQYLPFQGLELVSSTTNPNRIAIRDVKLEIWKEAMQANDTTRLQYAAKYRTLANAYKKWQGEMIAFKRTKALEEKLAEEKKMRQWIQADEKRRKEYGAMLENLEETYCQYKPVSFVNDYMAEAVNGIELIALAARLKKLVDLSQPGSNPDSLNKEIEKQKKSIGSAYKNYDAGTDEKVCAAMMELFAQQVPSYQCPWIFDYIAVRYKNNFDKYAHVVYKKSIFTDTVQMRDLLDNYKARDVKEILNDPAYQLMKSIHDFQSQRVTPQLNRLHVLIGHYQRLYTKALLEMNTKEKYAPDANSTLRVSYGKAEGIFPRDGVRYDHMTSIDGIFQKADSTNPDYMIPESLTTICRTGDYGRYGVNGTLPVNFISSTHTTGGNSGSPMLNARGELIGVNFDRLWEGILSDYYYEPALSRNISLDMRYVLFLVEKFGNCRRLIDEMKIVGSSAAQEIQSPNSN